MDEKKIEFEYEFRKLSDLRPDEIITMVCTFEQAEGAIPNGTLVRKIGSGPTDSHQDGAVARIVGSLGGKLSGHLKIPYAYFVLWEDKPTVPCFIAGTRIEEVK